MMFKGPFCGPFFERSLVIATELMPTVAVILSLPPRALRSRM